MSACSASCTCTFLSIDKYQQGNNWLVLSPCNQDVVRDSLYSHSISAGQCARLFLSSRQLLRVSFFAFLSADLRVSHVLVCILFLLSSSRIPTSASASTRAQLTRQFFATTRQCYNVVRPKSCGLSCFCNCRVAWRCCKEICGNINTKCKTISINGRKQICAKEAEYFCFFMKMALANLSSLKRTKLCLICV